MFVTRALLATLLLAAFSVNSSAQVPALTNADVIRLVAMQVSDQAVMTVVHQAKATQFDLSPRGVSDLAIAGVSTAVIATMRQSSTPRVSAPAAPAPAPAPAAQTLAGAAALAAGQRAASPSMWGAPLPNAGSSSPPVASTSKGTTLQSTSATPTNTTTTAAKDEAYWRERAAPAQQRIIEERQRSAPLRRELEELSAQLFSMGPLNKQRPGLETERQRLAAQVQVQDDIANVHIRALRAIEEEGRRAGALPSWFRN